MFFKATPTNVSTNGSLSVNQNSGITSQGSIVSQSIQPHPIQAKPKQILAKPSSTKPSSAKPNPAQPSSVQPSSVSPADVDTGVSGWAGVDDGDTGISGWGGVAEDAGSGGIGAWGDEPTPTNTNGINTNLDSNIETKVLPKRPRPQRRQDVPRIEPRPNRISSTKVMKKAPAKGQEIRKSKVKGQEKSKSKSKPSRPVKALKQNTLPKGFESMAGVVAGYSFSDDGVGEFTTVKKKGKVKGSKKKGKGRDNAKRKA